ncbi:zinc finger protein [Saccharopolyspora pogona]|uniref:zinc finger protein n=1 Tax=Saccharopolyspora pogona TaxID=333966 RepID=UPI0016897F96|nr:zinc finger protein [Saccharopolyspora pogona]
MPHPFRWAPADGERHASLDPAPHTGYPTGLVVKTLCERQLQVETGDIPWLWNTCPACDAKAHEIAQKPVPPTAGAR